MGVIRTYIHTCICIHMYVRTYTYTYVHVYTYTYTHVRCATCDRSVTVSLEMGCLRNTFGKQSETNLWSTC